MFVLCVFCYGWKYEWEEINCGGASLVEVVFCILVFMVYLLSVFSLYVEEFVVYVVVFEEMCKEFYKIL